MVELQPDDIGYTPERTAMWFHSSEAFVRGIRGPVRSGKSTMCSAELYRWANEEQVQGPGGTRRTRFTVVRNSYRELIDTTLKTWFQWFPEDKYGRLNRTRMVHRIKEPGIDMEVMFRALDTPGDIGKLLSLEITGAWINEARMIPKGLIDAMGDRVGQYPPENQEGCTRQGFIMDTNSMDDDHWWYRLASGLDEHGNYIGVPDGWEFFDQPGGLLEDPETGQFVANPEAENLKNIKGGAHYYLTRLAGKGKDHIRVYYCNQYGFVQEGKAVIPEYIDARHVAKERLYPDPKLKVYIGNDYGLTPAAAFLQKDPAMGRWRWIDELVTEDMGADKFGDLLLEKLNRDFRDCEFEIYGDPAGDDRSQTDKKTCFQILRSKGIPAMKAPSQDPILRRDALAKPMKTMCMDGEPAFQISPHCTVARKGLKGGYCLKRIQVSGDERYHEKPLKNKYSHVVEAGEYALLGAGEGTALISTAKKKLTARSKRKGRVRPGHRTSWMGR